MNICVIGTGYVGLVTGTCFAEFGISVTCADKDESKIGGLLRGEIPIYEPGLQKMVQRNAAEGRLHFTTDIAQGVAKALVVFIAVGTPPLDDGSADLSYVEEVAESIRAEGGEAAILALDLADREGVADSLSGLPEGFTDIDILVNNAGITRDNLLARLKPEDWDDVLATNLTGTFVLTKAHSDHPANHLA